MKKARKAYKEDNKEEQYTSIKGLKVEKLFGLVTPYTLVCLLGFSFLFIHSFSFILSISKVINNPLVYFECLNGMLICAKWVIVILGGSVQVGLGV